MPRRAQAWALSAVCRSSCAMSESLISIDARRNGRAFASLTARGGGLPVGATGGPADPTGWPMPAPGSADGAPHPYCWRATPLQTKSDTVRKTAKVVDSWFGQATRMVDVKHVDAFQGLFMACISGLEACLRPLCPSVGSRNH